MVLQMPAVSGVYWVTKMLLPYDIWVKIIYDELRLRYLLFVLGNQFTKDPTILGLFMGMVWIQSCSHKCSHWQHF
jgi:hypothetical protein